MNKQEEIIEGNYLIAKFMGYTYPSVDDEIFLYNHAAGHNYNEDWNLLMLIVEKIESMGTIIEIWMSLGKGCRITKGSFKEPIKTIATTESNSTIEAVWLAVIEFIKWYRPELANNKTLINE
jgi:hypothetical protein